MPTAVMTGILPCLTAPLGPRGAIVQGGTDEGAGAAFRAVFAELQRTSAPDSAADSQAVEDAVGAVPQAESDDEWTTEADDPPDFGPLIPPEPNLPSAPEDLETPPALGVIPAIQPLAPRAPGPAEMQQREMPQRIGGETRFAWHRWPVGEQAGPAPQTTQSRVVQPAFAVPVAPRDAPGTAMAEPPESQPRIAGLMADQVSLADDPEPQPALPPEPAIMKPRATDIQTSAVQTGQIAAGPAVPELRRPRIPDWAAARLVPIESPRTSAGNEVTLPEIAVPDEKSGQVQQPQPRAAPPLIAGLVGIAPDTDRSSGAVPLPAGFATEPTNGPATRILHPSADPHPSSVSPQVGSAAVAQRVAAPPGVLIAAPAISTRTPPAMLAGGAHVAVPVTVPVTAPLTAPVTAPVTVGGTGPVVAPGSAPTGGNRSISGRATPMKGDQIDAIDPSPMTEKQHLTSVSSRFDTALADHRQIDPVTARAGGHTTDTARHIATQLAQHMPVRDSPGFDIRLDPEELGHVRLKLVTHETGSMLIVHADRPETLDLMRRNIAMLEQDLRAMGHESLSLRFGSGGAGSGGQNPQTAQQMAGSPGAQMPGETPEPSAQTRTAYQTAGPRDHLDLRL